MKPDLLYYAISYCAGDPNNTTSISVNGHPFSVFASLVRALRAVRCYFKGSGKGAGERFRIPLWVDQICIDQSNPSERSHQVALMRDIYENADEVFTWLGGESSNGEGIALLNSLFDSVQQCLTDLDVRDETRAAKMMHSPMNTLARRHFDLLDAGEKTDAWKDIRDVLFSPWWQRCWVVQELITSRNATILYGPRSIEWLCFSAAAVVVYDVFDMIRNASYRKPELKDKFLPLLYDLDMTNIFFLTKKKEMWNDGAREDIKALLEHSRNCKTSDPRDRIYAFIGLADPRYGIIPSYESMSTTHVFMDAAKKNYSARKPLGRFKSC
jgi:hypothetical protein